MTQNKVYLDDYEECDEPHVGPDDVETLSKAVEQAHAQLGHEGPACFCREPLCDAMAAIDPDRRWSITRNAY